MKREKQAFESVWIHEEGPVKGTETMHRRDVVGKLRKMKTKMCSWECVTERCCSTSVKQPPESDRGNTRHFLHVFLLTLLTP